MELTKRLGERICETKYAQFPSEVVEYSKSLLLSSIGAMVAGSVLPSGRIMTQYVSQRGGNHEATLMGTGFRTSVENAAMANGTFAHATEYEDDSLPEVTSSFTIVSPILALGEKIGAPGRDVIEAFVVGNEVQTRVGIACLEARRRGYLNLSLSGTLGVAAAAAKLLNLDVHGTTMALSLAASQGSGIVRQSGSMAHYFEMGMAARNGIVAALLASEGFAGASDILEAPGGFLDLVTGGQVSTPEDIVNKWGAPFRVMEVGIKKYPCCYHMQRIIESFVQLKNENEPVIDDVDTVEVEVNPMLPQVIRHPEPHNAEEAQFSLPHGVAAALLEERIGPGSFSDEKVQDEVFRDMRSKVKTIVHEDWGWATVGWTPITTIIMKDGNRLSKQLARAKGEPPDFLPREDVIIKYTTRTEGILAGKQIDESVRLTLELERSDNVGRLVKFLVSQDKGDKSAGPR